MPSIHDAFPSNYLKAADLKGQPRLMTMRNAQFEKIGDDTKLILFFDGHEKGLVLNKTNATNIAFVYGDETNDWIGQQIVLFEAMVEFQGKTVAAIRVRMPQSRDRQVEAKEGNVNVATYGGGGGGYKKQQNSEKNELTPPDQMDDEIPF